tara:strand:- start:393 stop:884 length:492 start_codon:yes stop_codon:yes gene_type:complete
VQAIANKGWRRKTKLEVVDSLQSPRINVLMSIRSESMDARNFWRSIVSIKNTLKLNNEELSNKIISLVNEPHKIEDVEQHDFSDPHNGYIRIEVYLIDYRDPENDQSTLDITVAEAEYDYDSGDDVLKYRNLNDVISEINSGLSRVVPEYLDGDRDKFGQSND